jgi:23S rRNA U2552 (ribose-2'-O)-methylase RlmE/FtsJ
LKQIDYHFNILETVERAVDLCGAPGGWSEVIIEKIASKGGMLVTVDLQSMADIPGVEIIKGDITRQRTVEEILEKFHGEKADLIVEDGAPDVTGNHEFD